VTEIVVGALVALFAVFAAYFKGKSAQRQSTDFKDAQSRADTFERASNADTGNPDGSTDLDWLRNRAKPKRPWPSAR
jgi:hypothetical protein